MNLACDAAIPPATELPSRMSSMLLAAISEALANLPELRHARMACLIGVPESRPGVPAELSQLLSAALTKNVGIPHGAQQVLPYGHAASLVALQVAAQSVAAERMDVCIAAGVDSYHSPDTLEWLDSEGDLLSSANRNGFPPGEGAGACIIVSRAFAERHALPILAYIDAAGMGFEPNSIRSSQVCIGAGLTEALRNALTSLGPQQAISATYCDLNGQRYRSEEFSYALLRVQHAFADAHDYESPADCWGDLGAASGALFACLAIAAQLRGYAKGNHAILWTGSESGHRAAVVLRAVAT